MRHIAKVDANQAIIVEALRAAGATVALTHTLGGGFPDLVVAFAGRVYLMEVKNEDGKNELTEPELEFLADWNLHYEIVWTPEDALEVIGR